MQGFPKGFLFGTATAAYQVEGSVDADGKSESNWDHFTHQPGKVKDGLTGDVACDSYNRWQEDIRLMEWLGVNAYRFSVCWSRILPQGKGRVNERGLDFYSRFVDALLARGITPFMTLWHGDHPQVLEAAGGWTNRDMIHRYADYASVMFDRLGDRVKNWITLNEPNCFLYQGYGDGRCPPGETEWKKAYQAIHNALVGHGEAVRRLRTVRPDGRIGITMSCQLWTPATDDPRDLRAAELADLQNNLWLLDPIHGKGYPDVYREYLGELAPQVHDGDMAAMAEPTDFLAVNYYSNMKVKAGTLVPDRSGVVKDVVTVEELRDAGAFRQGLERLNRRYGPRVFYVTENGLYLRNDAPGPDGVCHDRERVAYLQAHTAALHDAIKAGLDVRGYFVWTLMDNFEWSMGFSVRFGLFYTDLATLQRTPKDSAAWYRDFLAGRHG